jgi:glycerol-3-phosphate O-acyltransferase
MPFVNGLKEFDEVLILSKIIRRCGGYFINQKNLKNPLYQSILEEWIGLMLKQRHILEYHIERRRERSGKIKQP